MKEKEKITPNMIGLLEKTKRLSKPRLKNEYRDKAIEIIKNNVTKEECDTCNNMRYMYSIELNDVVACKECTDKEKIEEEVVNLIGSLSPEELCDFYEKEAHVTAGFLNKNKNMVFVFGDNTIRKGRYGAAKLRDLPNTYGFITKKFPNNKSASFYRPEEYAKVFISEMNKLIAEIESNSDKIYLISKLGAGLANRFNIFEKVIFDNMFQLKKYDNVVFLW